MDIDELMESLGHPLSAAAKRNMARHSTYYRRSDWVRKNLFPWTNWPILVYIYNFWTSLWEEGIRATCKPRWGMITFAYLNDGYSPSLWHTWRQLTKNHSTDPYTGIYPNGAPRSILEAQERYSQGVYTLPDICDDCGLSNGNHNYDVEH